MSFYLFGESMVPLQGSIRRSFSPILLYPGGEKLFRVLGTSFSPIPLYPEGILPLYPYTPEGYRGIGVVSLRGIGVQGLSFPGKPFQGKSFMGYCKAPLVLTAKKIRDISLGGCAS